MCMCMCIYIYIYTYIFGALVGRIFTPKSGTLSSRLPCAAFTLSKPLGWHCARVCVCVRTYGQKETYKATKSKALQATSPDSTTQRSYSSRRAHSLNAEHEKSTRDGSVGRRKKRKKKRRKRRKTRRRRNVGRVFLQVLVMRNRRGCSTVGLPKEDLFPY